MTTRSTEERIGDVARHVLRTNDTGTLVKAAPDLYPHQWSWDAAFVAIGLATFDVPRALAELEHLRGPTWPVLTWFMGFQSRRHGNRYLYNSLRHEALSQLGDLQFGEYYEPFTGEPLGSSRQSWTAAVALDWLAPEP